MKNWSGHIIFPENFEWKQLEKSFRGMMELFFRESGEMEDEPDHKEVIMLLNMQDIKNNRKPEGYNREGKLRLIFPLQRKEITIVSPLPENYVRDVSEALSKYLTSKKIRHTLDFDQMKFTEFRKKRK
ncbi:MAG: hypothetical protein M1515_05575 [Candidatus Thermoplasmatota archaeon]|jgi:hypothetical protein|nr:hypothetical protein [Candidatus Thermoplasmatota archaeon]